MIDVATLYPADPLGAVPGGIDTIIRDVIRCAPEDFRYSLIGATTDPKARPVGRWTRCSLGDREFDFFPVYGIKHPGRQPRFPATIRHLAPLLIRRPKHKIDIIESHRIEPVLAYLRHPAPRFAFIHQNMAVLNSADSDIRWKHAPKLYMRLENWLIPRFQAVYCVHEQGVERYRDAFPAQADRIHFMPTWTNPDVFYPSSDSERVALRNAVRRRHNVAENAQLLISVGRLDYQKNPQRLLRAVAELSSEGHDLHAILVGDGVLRQSVEKLVGELGLRERVTLAGIKPNHEVADYLRACDALVLSSDYEGMPVCAIEALACGVPVVSTPVGEVSKVVTDGVNGRIASGFAVEELVAAIRDCLESVHRYVGTPCINAARPFVPSRVLAPVFDAYRRALRISD